MRFGKIASAAEYWMAEQLKKLSILGISIVFQIEKTLKTC